MGKGLWECATVVTVAATVGMKARSVARGLARALISAEPRTYLRLLADDAVLRMWRWDGVESHGGAVLVAERLAEEAAAWVDPRIDVARPVANGRREVVELRLTTGPVLARVAHQRCLVVTGAGGRAKEIDLYCSVPTAAGVAAGEVVQASWPDDELDRLLAGGGTELRDATVGGRFVRRAVDLTHVGHEQPDPAFNLVHSARLEPTQVNVRIDALVAWHRERGRGFTWRVSDHDQPDDLPGRLRAHGFMLEGDEATMVLRIPGSAPIPRAADVDVRRIDGTDPDENERALLLVASAFGWDDERVAAVRPWWPERLRTQGIPYTRLHYLARVGDDEVGFASMSLSGGVAQLNGAAVAPDARRRGVYTTLLACRIADAAERGYEIATSSAMPASREVMTRHGFSERGRVERYRWMPPEPQ